MQKLALTGVATTVMLLVGVLIAWGLLWVGISYFPWVLESRVFIFVLITIALVGLPLLTLSESGDLDSFVYSLPLALQN